MVRAEYLARALCTATHLADVNIGNHPELVPYHTVDQKVSSGDKTEKDMRDIAKEMVPDREPFTNIPILYTGPATQGHKN